MGLAPEQHHEDCDFRNSHAAKEAAQIMNVDVVDNSEVFDCNLGCANKATCDRIERVRELAEEARAVWAESGDDVDLALQNVLTSLDWAEERLG